VVNVLYVEDDAETREFIGKALEQRGFRVDAVPDAHQGFERGLSGAYDLAIVDVMLPESSGFELVRRLRAAGVETPMIFLTARGDVGDRIEGLNLGADDYLSKPFAFAELLARIRAVARRRLAEPGDGRVQVADLVVDLHRRSVTRAGRPIELAPREFQLLEYLARNAGHVVSRTMITEKVWGYGFEAYSNSIDVHVNRLRRKLDRDLGPRLIHTVKGVGYVLEDRGARGQAGERDEDVAGGEAEL
jgi:two-component system OmpR family response regulator